MKNLKLLENITCNDESWTRLGRLRDIAKWYLGGVPSSMSVSRNDGKQFVDPLYDKVNTCMVYVKA